MGSVKDLGSRPASASLRDLLSRIVRERGPAVSVERRQIPYWEERQWQRNGRTYSGSYRTPYAVFPGYAEQRLGGHIEFFLQAPSTEIRQSGHWACFQERQNGWYLVHMARQPKDVSSGIMTIERLVTEAYER